ncbi:unnamed protein product, partial [Staurois parvus]
MPAVSASSMAPASAHQCTSMPHIGAHLSLPFSATYQCQSVPPISAASQCHLSVLPVSATYQCPS